MTSAELAVVAALGASALTALASLGVVGLQSWLRGRAADRDTLSSAVTAMLARSMSVASRAQAMGLQMRLRSGLGEGLDVAARMRRPSDALELHDWMAADLAPMTEAWSVIWARGDQEMIRLANTLLGACSDLLGTSTALAPAETVGARLRRLVIGERSTPELEADLQSAMETMAHAREQLALHARKRMKLPPVQLLGHDPASDLGVPAPADGAQAAAPVPAPADANGQSAQETPR